MEAIKQNWEATKASERASREQMSVMDDIPDALPGLVRAQKLQKRAAQLGYDWTDKTEVTKAVEAEWSELSDVIDSNAEQRSKSSWATYYFRWLTWQGITTLMPRRR